MSKVTLTADQAEALESIRKDRNYLGDDWFLSTHGEVYMKTGVPWGDGFRSLNRLSMTTFCSALLIGYEVEKTPERLIREAYERRDDFIPHHSDGNVREAYGRGYNEGFRHGVRSTLQILNHPISGVWTAPEHLAGLDYPGACNLKSPFRDKE